MLRITKDIAEKRLADVPDEVVFRCHGGEILKNLWELGNALTGMGNEVFVYHVTEERNDFSDWVRNIIGDDKLAKDPGKSLNSRQAAKTVSSRKAFLEGKLV